MMAKRALGWAAVALMVGLLAVDAVAQGGDAGKLTVQQIKQQHPESVWHWIKALLGVGTGQQMATEVQIMILAALVVPICQVGSFWMKWASKMIPVETSMRDYFFRQDPQRTAYAFLTAYIAIGTGCFTGSFSTDEGMFVGWQNVLFNLVIVGTGGDLLVNKGQRRAWTTDERAAVAPAPAPAPKPEG